MLAMIWPVGQQFDLLVICYIMTIARSVFINASVHRGGCAKGQLAGSECPCKVFTQQSKEKQFTKQYSPEGTELPKITELRPLHSTVVSEELLLNL